MNPTARVPFRADLRAAPLTYLVTLLLAPTVSLLSGLESHRIITEANAYAQVVSPGSAFLTYAATGFIALLALPLTDAVYRARTQPEDTDTQKDASA